MMPLSYRLRREAQHCSGDVTARTEPGSPVPDVVQPSRTSTPRGGGLSVLLVGDYFGCSRPLRPGGPEASAQLNDTRGRRPTMQHPMAVGADDGEVCLGVEDDLAGLASELS
jgi:hypothetical protein